MLPTSASIAASFVEVSSVMKSQPDRAVSKFQISFRPGLRLTMVSSRASCRRSLLISQEIYGVRSVPETSNLVLAFRFRESTPGALPMRVVEKMVSKPPCTPSSPSGSCLNAWLFSKEGKLRTRR